jgi:hypothetical protein
MNYQEFLTELFKIKRFGHTPNLLVMQKILDKLDNVSDYTKFAIQETTDVLSTTVGTAREITESLGSATSTVTSATLQIGGGLTYATTSLGTNLKLAMTGEGRRKIQEEVVKEVSEGKIPVSEMNAEIERRIEKQYGAAESIKDWTVNAATKSTESIDNSFEKANNSLNNAVESVDNAGNKAVQYVDNVSNAAREKIEKAKREVEEKIQKVRDTFEKFTKDFDDAFGFLLPKTISRDAPMRFVAMAE